MAVDGTSHLARLRASCASILAGRSHIVRCLRASVPRLWRLGRVLLLQLALLPVDDDDRPMTAGAAIDASSTAWSVSLAVGSSA